LLQSSIGVLLVGELRPSDCVRSKASRLAIRFKRNFNFRERFGGEKAH